MDRNNFSPIAVETVEDQKVFAEISELEELALVCVGGGIGDTVL